MQKDLTDFLESLPHTSVYIINRETMEVFYENKTSRKHIVQNRIGKPCYLVHGNQSMCASCPLRKADKVSYAVREDIHMVLVIEAAEVTWQGKDAYAVFTRKQSEIPENNSMDDDLFRRMNRALNSSVLTYCEVNMKTFHERSVFFTREKAPASGEPYETHLKKMCEYFIYEQDRKRVMEAISLERLLALSADSEGPAEIHVRYRSSGHSGRSILLETTAYILRDELPHYVSLVTREVTYEEKMSMKLQLFRESIQDTVAIFQFNITQNQCAAVSGNHQLAREISKALDSYQTMDAVLAYMIAHVQEGSFRKEAKAFFDREQMLWTFENGRKSLNQRFPINMADGICKWLMLSLNMVKNPVTGEVEGILHTEEIEESIVKDNLLTQVINNDYDYIVLMDLQNNTARAFTNNGLYKPIVTDDAEGYIVDYLRRSYAGEDMETFIHKNTFAYIKKELEVKEQYIAYYYVKEKGRERRYKKGTYSYPNGDKRYLLFTRIDSTEALNEQKQINDRLSQALQQSKAASHAKTEIFSRMSHDLRTPMNAIVGMAKLGMDEVQDETSRHYFEEINVSGYYLLGLINDILDMNKLENDKVTLHEEPVDGRKFLMDIVEMMQPLLLQRNIKLVTEFQEIKNAYVFCDIIRTRQVFINFLSNAIKFSPPGSTVTWYASDIKAEGGRIYYEMRFIDHGCGMSEEFLERVFEPFEQEKNPYSSENPSTGLGLAIARNLVHIMGGSIFVESRLGEGSTFTLHLNHREAKEEELLRFDDIGDFSELNKKRILAAEDHPLNAEIELKLLKKQGMEVTMANDGKEALELFEKSEPYYYDAVLMDVRMPVMDGLEAAGRIRALERADAQTVPIIAITANAFDEDREASKAAGMTVHLSKPIIPKELYQTLQKEIS